MKKRRVTSPKAPEPPPQLWSNCLVVGDQIFVAGLTARSGEIVVGGDSMYEQSKAIFAKIAALLEAADAKMDDVVKMTIYVTDIERNQEVWKARREFFSGDYPVSTLVQVAALAIPQLIVEIDVVAIRGAGG